MKAKVYGIQHKKGTSKAGNPYDCDILHVAFLDPAGYREFEGSMVKELWIDRNAQIMPKRPPIGSTVDIGFSFGGRVEYVDLL